jgi:TetR/AcrR family transcriptional repressor of nem operon
MDAISVNRQPDITRARLLQAAFAEIHRNGYQAASLTDILTTAGLTKGALYHHFADKQALGLAVLDEIIGAYIQGTFVTPLADAPSPIQALVRILNEIGNSSCDASTALGCPFNNLMQEMSGIEPAFQERLAYWLEVWQNAFVDALRRAQENGEIRAEVDCDAAALFIIASMEGCMSLAKNHQSAATLRQCGGQLISYINMLKA